MTQTANTWVVKMHCRLATTPLPRDEFRTFRMHFYPEDGTTAVFELLEQRARRHVVAEPIVPRSAHVDAETGDPVDAGSFAHGKLLTLPLASGEPLAFVITKTGPDLDSLRSLLASHAREAEHAEALAAKARQSARDAEAQRAPAAAGDGSALGSALAQIRAAIRVRTGADTGENTRVRSEVGGGYGGLKLGKLGKHFRILDDSGDGKLSRAEFAKALSEYGVRLSAEEMGALEAGLDRDGDGCVCYEEFLMAVRGEMPESRRELVRLAFRKLDANRNGVVDLDDIRRVYNAKAHPKVIGGNKTEDEVLLDFLNGFDAGVKDGRIEWTEFLKYYEENVSISIDDDEYFAAVMEKAWGVRPGQTEDI